MEFLHAYTDRGHRYNVYMIGQERVRHFRITNPSTGTTTVHAALPLQGNILYVDADCTVEEIPPPPGLAAWALGIP